MSYLSKFWSRIYPNAKIGVSNEEESSLIHETEVINSTKYDMVKELDERYYSKQYWHWILRAIKAEKLPDNSICLDLGCGQGRLSFPLAKYFKTGKVNGVDFSLSAIEKAKEYLLKDGLDNLEFSLGSIKDMICNFKLNSYNLIIINEVTFFYPEWRDTLEKIKSILKPGGLLLISFRSQYFNALCLVKNRLFSNLIRLYIKLFANHSGHK